MDRSGTAEPLGAAGRARDGDVAVIGIGCRLPGADNPDQFWSLLEGGHNAVTPFPEERARLLPGEWGDAGAGASPSYFGGFIHDVDRFDAGFFGLSRREAELMDPQQRLLLETCWHALEDARVKPSSLSAGRTGVYVGVCNTDYAELLDRHVTADDLYVTTGSFASMLANRLSFLFDLKGPSLSIDTSCSSSLMAVHLAERSIRAGDCDVALVSGVNLCLTPKRFRSFDSGGMLSADGQCKTFDAGANGYVRGEGVVTLVLKRLAAAEATGDRIYGIIRGSAINHGGKTRGLTVTSSSQQQRLLVGAYRDAGVPFDTVGYVEVHGTGTALGDPVEVLGLKLAREELQAGGAGRADAACALGSVKTNIGHLEAAAGIAGLAKVLLALRHRRIPASLNFQALNPFIKIENTPFHVPVDAAPWPALSGTDGPLPRRAGVSSFGFGGAYAHVVAEEWSAPAAVPANPSGPAILTLSAKDEAALRRQAQALADYLNNGLGGGSLHDVAYTLQMAREAMEHRLTLPATTAGDAAASLSVFAAGRESKLAPGSYHHGKAARRQGATQAFAGDPALCRQVAAWLRDAGQAAEASVWEAADEPDWASLYDAAHPALIDLPGYPFAPDRYWVPMEHAAPVASPEEVTLAPATMMAPRWVVLPDPMSPPHEGEGPRRYIISGSDQGACAAAAAACGPCSLIVDSRLDEDELVRRLSEAGEIDGVIWVGAAARRREPSQHDLAADQARAVQELERLANALLRHGGGGRNLTFLAVTSLALRIGGDTWHDPASAAVHEWVSMLATRFPEWRCRSIDGPADVSLPWGEALALPDGPQARLWAWRGGEWLRHEAVLCVLAAEPVPRFRQNGRYLIAADAGAEALRICGTLLRRYRAELVLAGRWPRTGEEWRDLMAAAGDGPAPLLIDVDAARCDWSEVIARARAECVSPHGIIQVAEASCSPASLDAALDLRQAFAAEQPDFMLLVRTASGASGAEPHVALVSAGSLARFLGEGWTCPVRTAVVASAGGEGTGAEEPGGREALIDALLDGPLDQLMLVRAHTTGGEELVTILPHEIAPPPLQFLAGSAGTEPPEALLGARAQEEWRVLEEDLAALLFARLEGEGLIDDAGRVGIDVAAARSSNPTHAHWLRHSMLALMRVGLLESDGEGLCRRTGKGCDADEAWRRWRAHREAWLGQGLFRPQIAILDEVLEALPSILAGKTLLTEILFSSASLGLMEDYYQNNPTADYFNDTIAALLSGYLDQRLARDPAAQLRILEIGAGTGGTTARVLPKLLPHAHAIADYTYTDLSRSFLAHGERRYGANAPFMRFAIFDVERTLIRQQIDPASYDVVIANNVLHATRNMRDTLRHAKAAMKRGGMLLLNEINRFDMFLHVAFGLLDGWWRFDDPALRIAGTPALTSQTWHRLLQQEGFEPVAFPARSASALGQDVIVAVSNGTIDGAIAPAVPARPEAGRASAIAAQVEGTSVSAAEPRQVPAHAPQQLASQVQKILFETVAEVLKLDEAAIALDQAFADYGMDSIVGVQAVKRLNARLGTDLSTIVLFDYGTPRALISHVVATSSDAVAATLTVQPPAPADEAETALEPLDASEAKRAVGPPAPAAGGKVPIAIIGASGRSGGAATLSELWDHLARGEILIEPASRWDLEAPFRDELPPGGRYCRQGGFLHDIASFDPTFFNIAGAEALCMDPQQRIFLEEAWQALEDAGHAGSGTHGSRCGVYVGYIGGDYDRLFPPVAPPQTMWGNAGSMLAARIAYLLNLRGPAITIDTACSSSLVALHAACQALWIGDIDMALAGGVFVQSTPDFFVSANRAGMLSPDGVCYAFDNRANGFVPGEGAGAVVLKRLDDAIRDGDQIQGVIQGIGVNQDGASNGITAPSALAQEELQRQVYAEFGIDPADITLIEAHGTGTKLGDPIEVRALTQSFRAHTAAEQYCALGSVKANIGHTAAAAGMMSVLKVLLALRHGQIPPCATYSVRNEAIPLTGSPFYVPTRLGNWVPGASGRRMAAVSSFGLSGTNAHAVIAAPPAMAPSAPSRPAYLLVLSARSAAELEQQVRRLVSHLAADESLNAGDICFTLATGRRHFAHRIACVVRDRAHLMTLLQSWLTSGAHSEVRTGTAAPQLTEHGADESDAGNALVRRCASDPASIVAALGAIADLFVSGVPLDLAALFQGAGRRRVSLPTYPFARDRYWMGDHAGAPTRPAAMFQRSGDPALSKAGQPAVFDFQLTSDDAVVSDHRIGGRCILPGVFYLELARTAFLRLLDENGGGHGAGDPVLENIIWRRPAIVDGAITLSVLIDATKDGSWTFTVVSEVDPATAERLVHVSGRARRPATAARPRHDIAALRDRASRQVDVDALYGHFAELGVAYGRSFRRIAQAWTGRGAEGERMVLSALTPEPGHGAYLSPGALDSALQATFADAMDDIRPRLLFAMDGVQSWQPVPDQAWVVASRGHDASEAWRVDVCDGDGRLCVRMNGVAFRAESREGTADAPALRVAETCALAVRRWVAVPLEPVATATPAAHQLLLAPSFAHQAAGLRDLLPGARIQVADLSGAWTAAGRAEAFGLELLAILKQAADGSVQAGRAVQVVVPDLDPAHPDFAVYRSASGLVRTARLEHPDLLVQLLFTDPEQPIGQLANALGGDAGARGDAEIAYRAGRRYVSRIEPAEAAAPARPSWRPDGVYLITGGAGGLGRMFAQDIIGHAPRARVVLLGRRAGEEVGGVGEDGGRITYRQVDLCDRAAVCACVETIVAAYGRLDGVLHAAGVLGDELIFRKSLDAFRATLAPKTAGTINLDEATRALPLDFFALFSSLASVIGNVGQVDYAAANAFLDGFAEHREALVARSQRSGRTVSINWPWWQAGGMQVAPQMHAGMVRRGLNPISSDAGIAAFHSALAQSAAQVAILPGGDAQPSPILGEANGVRFEGKADTSPATPHSGTDGSLRFVRQILSVTLRVPERRIGPGTRFEDLGVDSILAVQVVSALEEDFGPLPKTLLFESRSVAELAADLDRRFPERFRRIAAELADPAPATFSLSQRRSDRDSVAMSAAPIEPAADVARASDIAIIGLAGRYPGAETLQQFWANLKRGLDSVEEVPPGRWDHSRYFDPVKRRPGKAYAKWGGFLPDIDAFDAEFFNISPREAEMMDPQERLFLQCAYHALEDAGYPRPRLARSTGVFVGLMYQDYQLFAAEAQARGEALTYLNHPSSIANRVSYSFDLNGPSMAVDTMCSSSLTAVHLACQSLAAGECETAIAGGVNLTIHPNKYLALSRGLFAASNGRCQSFGTGGDGYVPSEGVGAVLLKQLAQAQRDGDRIYGVIRGSAVNHGGHASGFSVPTPAAQQAVVATALARAGSSARSVSYVEAHGTGTALGDPIEVAGLSRAFAEHTADRGFCAIGSVKSNIGHCEGAAGIAGLTKVLLQMQHKSLAPSIHAQQLNDAIDFDAGPFRLQRTLGEWANPGAEDGEGPIPRLAGLSSFGAGGSNVHLLVEEVRDPAALGGDDLAPSGPAAFLFSARTAPALRTLVEQFAAGLERGEWEEGCFHDIAYTLQVGREAFEHRLAICASDLDALGSALRTWLSGGEQQDIWAAQVRAGDPLRELHADEDMGDMFARWMARREIAKLCRSWVLGGAIDWARLHDFGSLRRRIVSLPGYPFAKDRYWVPASPAEVTPQQAAVISEPVHLLARQWQDQPATSSSLASVRPSPRVIVAATDFGGQVAEYRASHPDAQWDLLAPAPDGVADAFRALAVALVSRLRGLLAPGLATPTCFQLVVPEGSYGPAMGAMLRSAVKEDPLLTAQVIALDKGVTSAEFAARIDECAARPEDREILYAGGRRMVSRLGKASRIDAKPDGIWQATGVYLIVGGGGALGRVFADEIVRRAPTATVILAGRSPLSSAPAKPGDARVEYCTCDVADASSVKALIRDIGGRYGRLDGIIQAAGVLQDGWLIGKSAQQVERALRPKVDGVVNLDEATAQLPLAFFAAFSSLAGVVGNAGQADYAAANAFVSSYMERRSERVRHGGRSGRSLSIAWPLWNAGGMQVDPATARRARDELGMVPLDLEEGIRAFYDAYALSDHAEIVVLKGDASKLIEAPADPAALNAAPAPARRPGAQSSPLAAVTYYLNTLVGRTLKLPTDRVSAERPIESYGIDSVVALEMISEMEGVFGSLPKTLFFQHPSLGDIAQYLIATRADACARLGLADDQGSRVGPAALALAPAAEQVVTLVEHDVGSGAGGGRETDIAIIGIAGRYPGARTLDQFWDNLRAGRDSVTEIPAERWDFRPFYDEAKGSTGRLYCKWGGFIDGVDEFDALFFNIAPAEAQTMGPQERLFLQCAYETLEDAGYTRQNVSTRRTKGRDRNVGVFVGAMYDEYQLYNLRPIAPGSAAPSSNPASIANRVSFFCDFRGPSITVNTMCSSSLTAIHMACEGLRSGECEVAIAGGVNVSIHPSKYVTLSQGQFVSATGHCRSFGRNGDGYVPGEGVGAVLLKPLAQALADGDHIHGVIRGSGVNHGGRGGGYTVPLARAQADLIRQVLADAKVEPGDISYVEAHGTGTSLGDPIEIEGLADALGGSASAGVRCAIGSVKSNIGHCESAAGMAGLTKVILQLRHGMLAPSLHSRELNPNLSLEGTPFFIPQESCPWPVPHAAIEPQRTDAGDRVAGISSFGAGGANAHLIVSGRLGTERSEAAPPLPATPALVVLSARTLPQLIEVARRLRAACAGLRECDLPRLAYTLQTGREAMELRAALVVGSVAELGSLLDRMVAASGPDDRIYRVQPTEAAHGLEEVARRWVAGAEIEWTHLYPAGLPKRMALPTYPFERRRHWVELEPEAEAKPARASLTQDRVDGLAKPGHPLLQHGQARGGGLRFTSRFSGGEPLLADHQVDARPIMPAAACLEIMRAAAERLGGGAGATQAGAVIRNASWSRALTVTDGELTVVADAEQGSGDAIIVRLSEGDTAGNQVCAEGQVSWSGLPVLSGTAHEADRLREQARHVLTGPECYQIFSRSGIEYGDAFRGLESLHAGMADGTPFALAFFTLPVRPQANGSAFGMDPVILDLAFQSCLGIALLRQNAMGAEHLPVLEIPFALDALIVAGQLPASGQLVARARADGKLDVSIYDLAGQMHGKLEGISVRKAPRTSAAQERQTQLLQPNWSPLDPVRSAAWPDPAARLLVIGADPAPAAELRTRWPGLLFVPSADAALDVLSRSLDGGLDHILWCVGTQDPGPVADPVAAQESGLLAGHALVRALADAGFGGRPLGWTVITRGTQPVRLSDRVDAAHAGLHGFFGVVAKEYPDWTIRLIDLEAGKDGLPDMMWHLAAHAPGETLAIRGEIAFRLVLEPAAEERAKSPYRQGGVYVIVGGAGGIGEVLTAHLLRRADARVIWFGRRALDDAIGAKLDRMARLGRRPEYVIADAGDLAALSRARAHVIRAHGRIDGVVNAAIDLADRAIGNMSAADLRLAIRAKVDAAAYLARLFASDDLDFLALFSSMQSFARPAGQSGYVAGSSFLDAYAAQLQAELPFPVKVMNWGYWGHVGAVASPEIRARMAQGGVGSIDPVAGMAALDRLLAGEARQLAFMVSLNASAAQPAAIVPALPEPLGRAHAAPRLLKRLREQRLAKVGM